VDVGNRNLDRCHASQQKLYDCLAMYGHLPSDSAPDEIIRSIVAALDDGSLICQSRRAIKLLKEKFGSDDEVAAEFGLTGGNIHAWRSTGIPEKHRKRVSALLGTLWEPPEEHQRIDSYLLALEAVDRLVFGKQQLISLTLERVAAILFAAENEPFKHALARRDGQSIDSIGVQILAELDGLADFIGERQLSSGLQIGQLLQLWWEHLVIVNRVVESVTFYAEARS
jgi:hypothetical protein